MQTRIILVEIEGEVNLGSICRLMKNFGFDELHLVNPRLDLNKLSTAYGYAMHAKELLKDIKVVSSLEDACTDVDYVIGTTAIVASEYNPLRIAIPPEELQPMVDLKGKTAIVFGREGTGLTNEELNNCDVVVFIPASSVYPTLNIAQAAAIILYTVFRLQGKGRKRAKFRAANQIEKGKLLEYFVRLLEKINYMEAKRPIAERIFRNVIGRSFISGRECHTLLGVFRRLYILVRTR